MYIKLINIFTLFTLLFEAQAFAAKVLQSNAEKVLVELTNETLSVGQKIFLINQQGKKIAIVQVLQLKNKRAILNLQKGTVVGATDILLPNSDKKKSADSADAESENYTEQNVYRLNALKLSILGNVSINAMSTLQSDGTQPTPNQETVKLNGFFIGVTGAVDYPFNDWLTLRGTLGYEPFVAKGTAQFRSCDSLTSKDCTANLHYLASGGYARFNITQNKNQIWAGFGLSGKFPVSKTTTALRSDDINFTFTMALAGGVDYYISNKNFIPFSVEYQLFQNSETVTANIILLRAGYGWAF